MFTPNEALFDVTQLIAGSGALYVAPLGTTLPTLDMHGEFPVAWPSGWVPVGYTDAGIDCTYTPTVKAIMVDEEASPVDDVLAEEKFHIMAHLAQVTLSNYSNAISASTFTGADADSVIKVAIGSKPLSYVMLGVEGPAPGTNLGRVVIVQKAIANAAVGFKIQRKDKVVFPVQWEARKISGIDLVDIYDFTSTAS